MRYLYILIAICFFYGCSDPGYSARIHISSDARATEDDIKLITDILKQKTYQVIMTKNESNWKVESYKILLNEKRFNGLNRQYIMFVIEYYYSGTSSDLNKLLDKIEVRIGNSWEGRKPIVKEEIDQIVDYLLSFLIKRFGDSVISTEKGYVSPP